jgi:hypothetical protein
VTVDDLLSSILALLGAFVITVLLLACSIVDPDDG